MVNDSPTCGALDLFSCAPSRTYDSNAIAFQICPINPELEKVVVVECAMPTYRIMSSAMLNGSLPTLVPPNFWTIHPPRLLFLIGEWHAVRETVLNPSSFSRSDGLILHRDHMTAGSNTMLVSSFWREKQAQGTLPVHRGKMLTS